MNTPTSALARADKAPAPSPPLRAIVRRRAPAPVADPLPPAQREWVERVMSQRSSMLELLVKLARDEKTPPEDAVRAATMFLQNTTDVARLDSATMPRARRPRASRTPARSTRK